MEMEFINILRVLWHWRSLIISISLVALIALVIRFRIIDPVYESSVKLQLTTPQIEDMTLFESYRYVEVRDQVAVARNNLTEVLMSEEVYLQTCDELNLDADEEPYEINVEQIQDSDFIVTTVTAGDKELVSDIANAHVAVGINYFGELRAKPAKAEKELIYNQMLLAGDDLKHAESTFVNFKTSNNILSLDEQILTSQRLIEELKLQQDRSAIEPVDVVLSEPAGEETVLIEDLITAREAELETLVSLQPEYNLLYDETVLARQKYQFIKDKYNEAELKVLEIEAVNFIQVVQEATTPVTPEESILTSIILPLIGTFGFAVILTFLFEYLLGISERRSATRTSFPSETPVSPVRTNVMAEATHSSKPSESQG
jgi:capsular polysaccharide biosynthesis protein